MFGSEKRRYKIIRFYFNDNIPSRTIKKGLTKQQAMSHCQDPETSSKTCTTSTGKQRTKTCGPWFDGFDSY